MSYTFTAIFEKVEGWYIGYLEELPGVNTQAKTLKEARVNLKEAAIMILEANRELAERDIGRRKVHKETLEIVSK